MFYYANEINSLFRRSIQICKPYQGNFSTDPHIQKTFIRSLLFSCERKQKSESALSSSVEFGIFLNFYSKDHAFFLSFFPLPFSKEKEESGQDKRRIFFPSLRNISLILFPLLKKGDRISSVGLESMQTIDI